MFSCDAFLCHLSLVVFDQLCPLSLVVPVFPQNHYAKIPHLGSPNMTSLPTGCCAVQRAMWKGGGLTSRDRLNSSENYLLLGILLAVPSQTVLLLVRQSVT